jgi:hypothetical protein
MKIVPTSLVRLLALFLALAFVAPWTAPAAEKEPELECQIKRSRKMRIEGGDYDDKTEKISFDITLTNKHWKEPVSGLNGVFYVFGESVHDRKAFKLVQKENFRVEIEPRGTFETTTPIAEMKYDTTGASFGEKYRGWVLCLENEEGLKVYEEASSAFIKDTTPLAKLDVGEFCDREGKLIAKPERP